MTVEQDFNVRINGETLADYIFVDKIEIDGESQVWISANVRGGSTRLSLSMDEAKRMIEALTAIVEAQ